MCPCDLVTGYQDQDQRASTATLPLIQIDFRILETRSATLHVRLARKGLEAQLSCAHVRSGLRMRSHPVKPQCLRVGSSSWPLCSLLQHLQQQAGWLSSRPGLRQRSSAVASRLTLRGPMSVPGDQERSPILRRLRVPPCSPFTLDHIAVGESRNTSVVVHGTYKLVDVVCCALPREVDRQINGRPSPTVFPNASVAVLAIVLYQRRRYQGESFH